MDRNMFLNCVIDDGVMEISSTYLSKQSNSRRDGGIAGFEACRGKTNQQLVELLMKSQEATIRKRLQRGDVDLYWYLVMYERQVEWVINTLNARALLLGEERFMGASYRGLVKACHVLERPLPGDIKAVTWGDLDFF